MVVIGIINMMGFFFGGYVVMGFFSCIVIKLKVGVRILFVGVIIVFVVFFVIYVLLVVFYYIFNVLFFVVIIYVVGDFIIFFNIVY